ncbi:MAG: hypothetical protein Q3982_05820 [Phoenicibacter congonensis]|uniref:Uncharacterized protein n=1 Tax=Phoenicibacter congonensis TaxID=1944646 RepID=A0AA43RMC5_9ACTN|nr:hypothetical protein [Phoenicibacter congonensis]
MDLKKIAAAVLAAATVLTYNMGYFPSDVTPQSSITAEAFDNDGGINEYPSAPVKITSLGTYQKGDNTSQFHGYLNKYYNYTLDTSTSTDTVKNYIIIKGKTNGSGFKTAQFPAPFLDSDGVLY